VSRGLSPGIEAVLIRVFSRSMPVGSMTSSAIRESTSRLASMSFNGQGRNPSSDESVSTSPGSRPSLPGSSAQDHRPHHPSHLSEIITEDDEIPSPRTVPASLGHGGPSALSVMMDKERSGSTESLVPPVRYSGSNGSGGSKTPSQPVPIRLHSDSSGEDLSGEATPTGRPAVLRQGSEDEDEHSSSALRTFLSGEVEREDAEAASEVTPLLGTVGNRGGWTDRAKEKVSSLRSRAGKFTTQDVVRECVQEPAKAVPAVILGLLLNVLDGVSYGMIL
jgi:SulP family sulfate permease